MVTDALAALKANPATTKANAHLVLATDGVDFAADDLETGDTAAGAYRSFPNHFGLLLPLAGITTVKQIRESAFNNCATGRMNRLYVELLKENPDRDTAERRRDMNHFVARLTASICDFCLWYRAIGLVRASKGNLNAIESYAGVQCNDR